jgi:hypothetical protein
MAYTGARLMIVNVIVDCICNLDTVCSLYDDVRLDVAILAQGVQVWQQPNF